MPARKPVRIGEKYGWLTVIGESMKVQRGEHLFEYRANVRCECGKEFFSPERDMRRGLTKSCGCKRAKYRNSGDARRIHGMSKTKTYASWAAMHQRCTDIRHPSYGKYGGAGITICDRWQKFENFLEDMGERPSGLTLDRFPNRNGDYEPKNCRWATTTQQADNTSSAKIVLLDGETISTSEASRRLGIGHGTIAERMRTHGVSRQEAIDYYASKRKNPHQHGPKAES